MKIIKPSPLWLGLILAPLAGAVVPLSLAPFDIWPFGVIACAVLAWLMIEKSGKGCLLMAFLFGIGLYGVGASWVYISISKFGSSSPELALLLTACFVSGLAFCFALPFYAYGKWISVSKLGLLLGFPAVYMLGEWMRSWFLTGFPWLYLGYGHIHSPLAGWAPVFGVFGLGLFTAFTSTTLLHLWDNLRRKVWCKKTLLGCGITAFIWVTGALLNFVNWTELSEKPIRLGMAQGNIPQERKWDPDYLGETYKIFYGLSEKLWRLDWVIWPEAAIPLLYTRAENDLKTLDKKAKATNTVFITGILYDDWDKREIYNSLVALGRGSGISFKTRLVPFGEYVPLEKWLRGTIEFFDLPTSVIHPGPAYEQGLNAKGVIIAPSICYEVVYPDLVADRAASANVLLTVSNDAWFGLSIGPVQHFQMAQMRALETGRYMIRSTNNGISGIINHKGKIIKQGRRYTRETITGRIYSASGNTPFIVWGSWPMVIAGFLMGGICVWCRK